MQNLGLPNNANIHERTILVCPANRTEHDSDGSIETHIQINI